MRNGSTQDLQDSGQYSSNCRYTKYRGISKTHCFQRVVCSSQKNLSQKDLDFVIFFGDALLLNGRL